MEYEVKLAGIEQFDEEIFDFFSDFDTSNLLFTPTRALFQYGLEWDVTHQEVIEYCKRNDLNISDGQTFELEWNNISLMYRFVLTDDVALFKLALAGLTPICTIYKIGR